MEPPNVVCLVLDCLRADAITASDAPNIHALAERNLSFDACVTPANWSLPAHASLFTGEWPHDHGYFRRDQSLGRMPLIETLNDEGYQTVGTSANVFASSSYGFDHGFDHFYETRRPLNSKGLNPFARVRQLSGTEEPGPAEYARTFLDSLAHDHPVASVDNFGRSVALSLDRRFGLRRYLPFVDDDRYGFLTRAADRSTAYLAERMKRVADGPVPLFAFANYMNTHYPYQPPERHFRAVTDGERTLSELRNMDPDISHSRVFRDTAFADRIDEEDVTLVRAAYRAEVRSVDEQVGRLLEALEAAGIREETIVVVTADHGECLGEGDLRNERAMGHFDGLSEHLWTVPLIVANPRIDPDTVETHTSLKSLFDLLVGDLAAFLEAGGRTWDDHFDDDPVFFELPANPTNEASLRSYSHYPDWFVERIARTHTVVGFDGPYVVVVDSNGQASGFRDGDPVDVSSIPDALYEECEDAVGAFEPVTGAAESDLSDDVTEQLADLGYV
jgi:arylsulfatase A-like enzyme